MRIKDSCMVTVKVPLPTAGTSQTPERKKEITSTQRMAVTGWITLKSSSDTSVMFATRVEGDDEALVQLTASKVGINLGHGSKGSDGEPEDHSVDNSGTDESQEEEEEEEETL